jgi:Flp pilus assembly protein TadD
MYNDIYIYIGSKRGLEGPAQMAQGTASEVITAEQESIAIELEASVHLNIATCQIRLNVPLKALEHAGKAIELKPDYWKAHLRKAEAHTLFCDFEKATAALDKATSLVNSEDTAGKTAIANARSRLLIAEKEAKRKQQKEWAGIFSK